MNDSVELTENKSSSARMAIWTSYMQGIGIGLLVGVVVATTSRSTAIQMGIISVAIIVVGYLRHRSTSEMYD